MGERKELKNSILKKKRKKICLKTTAADKLTQTGWSQEKLEDHVSKAIQFYLHEVATFFLSLGSTVSKRSFSLNYSYKLEKDMATHSSVPASGISWTEEPGGCSPRGHKRVRQDLATKEQQHIPKICRHGCNKSGHAPLCVWARWSKWDPLDVHWGTTAA